jgi:branched-chain amino acid transport system permease protein
MWRMTGESVLAAVLATIALGILLRGAMILAFGTQTQYPLRELGWTNASIAIGESARISAAGLVLVLGTAVVYAALFVFLRATRWGIRMRAAGQNPLLAAQRGIRLHGVYALAWGLATFTGGMAGMLIACDAGIEATLVTIGLKAFPAALVGGLDSLLGALAGSLIIAGAEVLLIHFVDPLLSDVVPFFVLLAMLVIRPWGLFGTREELDRV